MIVTYNQTNEFLYGKKPNHIELIHNTSFGKPRENSSFTGEQNLWTNLLTVCKSGYLDTPELTAVATTHPLMEHMLHTYATHAIVDFTDLNQIDENYASYEEVPQHKTKQFTACTLFYNMHLGSVMRYLGNNYTNQHIDVDEIMKECKNVVPEDIRQDLHRVLTKGSPNKVDGDVSYQNFLDYYFYQNHSTVSKNPAKVKKAVLKEFKSCWIFILPIWMARFIPNGQITPHGLIVKLHKNDRIVFDASCLLHPESRCLNMFSSKDTEPKIHYKYSWIKYLIRLWNLRISYPLLDILMMADDVSGAFRQPKYNPEIISGFMYILANYLCVSCGLNFGNNFSPSSFEPYAQAREYLAQHYFERDDLVEKYKELLKLVKFSESDFAPEELVQAVKDSLNQGVMDTDGKPKNTPHNMFVDDNMLAEISRHRLLKALAAGFEAIFLLFGQPDIAKRKIAIALDKLTEMISGHEIIVLGMKVNTRRMTVMRDPAKLDLLRKDLADHGPWTKKRKQFCLKELSSLLGRVEDMARHAIWAKTLYMNLRTSAKKAYRENKTAVQDSPKFKNLWNDRNYTGTEEQLLNRKKFAESKLEKAIWNHNLKHNVTRGMKQDLHLLREYLSKDFQYWEVPISHLVPRIPDFQSHGDACLNSGGGWSSSLKFWWYYAWPKEVREKTLKYWKRDFIIEGERVSINLLEFLVIIINYAAASFIVYLLKKGEGPKGLKLQNQYPILTNWADNTSAVKWALNACNSNEIGKALSRILSAINFGNPLGLNSNFISGDDNFNADKISRFLPRNVQLQFDKLQQDQPMLKQCQRLHPSKYFISILMEALLQPRKLLLKPNQLKVQMLFDPVNDTT